MGQMDIFKAAYFTPLGTDFALNGEQPFGPPMLWKGPPGSAKTSWARRFCKLWGEPFATIKPGADGEGKFGVTPVPITDSVTGRIVLVFPPIEEFARKFAPGHGLFFIDELNTAPRAHQAPLLGAIQERQLGDFRFAGGVRVIGAMNSVEDAAGGTDLAPSVANRMGHRDWEDPEASAWAAWLVGGGENTVDPAQVMDARSEEARVMAAWPEAWAKAAGVVAGYLRARPEMLRKQPKAIDPQSSGAWPSPRSWEMSSRALAGSEIHRLSEIDQEAYVSSFIGISAAREFLVWRKQQDLPDPAAILDGRLAFAHNPARLDRTYVVLNACASLVANKACDRRQERGLVMWNLMSSMTDQAGDLVAPMVLILHRAGLANYGSASNRVIAALEPIVAAVRATQR